MIKKKVLIIVAHPDDETIWMGGTILKNKNKWNTTIISLCRKDDLDRAPKFFRVCKILGAKGFMSDLDDEKMNDLNSDEVITHIKKFCKKNYDLIFTHGKNGEYGHKRHIDVHHAVIKMIENKDLSTEKLFFFSYEKIGELAIAKQKPDKFIKLNHSELIKKRELIQDVYGFQISGFEYNCCKDLEAFDLFKKITQQNKNGE